MVSVQTQHHLAGIIHPTAFQLAEMSGMMAHAYESKPQGTLRYKNLELAIWQETFASNERKTISVLFDGKLSNAAELKKELKSYHFQTGTDAEIAMHAYDEWGERFISRLDGCFAIALFDEHKELLYLIRDRLGRKNLYWSSQGSYFLFSSEIKGLLASGLVPQTASVTGLASYLYFGFFPQDITPISNVNKLLPGHYLRVDLDRHRIVEQFWSLSKQIESKHSLTKEEAYEQLSQKLATAHKSAMPPAGCPHAILTASPASKVMGDYVSQLTGQIIPPAADLDQAVEWLEPEELLADLVKIVWVLDEPIADPYIMQTWRLSQSAAKEGPCAFADLGWAEFFAGNPRYFTSPHHIHRTLFNRLAALPPRVLEEIVFPLVPEKTKWRILRNIDIDHGQIAYQARIALFEGHLRKKASPFLYRYFDPEVFTQRFHRLTYLPGSVEPFLYFDAKTELPDRQLHQYERLFSHAGVELITPFLDHHLIEWISKVPEEIKCEGKIPGVMLLKHLGNRPPEAPLPSFIEKWCDAPAFRGAFELLTQGLLAEEGLISQKWIHDQLGYPHLIPANFRQLFALLVLEIWFRLYINKPISPVLATSDLYKLLK